MRRYLARLYEDAAAGRLGPSHSPLFRVAMNAVHVAIVLVRETVRDRLHVRAAQLSYWTAVAIVPILLLGFAMTGPLGLGDQTRDAVKELLYDTILAQSVEEVGGAIDTLLDAASLGTLGAVGVVGIMFIGSQLYFNAELAYNDIFRTRVRRSWVLRFTLFYAGITLGPLFLASGFVLSARFGAEIPFIGRLLPIVLTAAVLVGAIRLLPCRPVRWQSAATGGLISAMLFEAAKMGFGAYTELLGTRDNMAVIYGSVAFLPVFLLWMYILWGIVLFGVELAFLVEHHGSLIDAQRRLAIDPHASRRQPDGFFAVALMNTVCEHFEDGDGPVSAQRLSRSTGADPRHVQTALDILEDAGLLLETEDKRYMPARPPQSLPASEVLRAWRSRAAPAVHGPAAGAIHVALAAIDHAMSGHVDRLGGRKRKPGDR